MESETELSESNLNSVKEMLLDEDKIVTYISLSKDLCVHVNISKILLHQVVQNIRQDKPNLELKVSYLISGLSNSNEARITVCPETELEELRNTFKIIYFEHIYSISKGNSTNFLLINNFNDFSLCSGSIKNSACMKRSSCEINNFKSSSLIVPEASLSKPPNKKVKTESIEKVTNNYNGSHQEDNKISVNIETKVKKEKPSPKKENNSKQSNQKINGNKPQKGIVGFFNKTSVVSKKNATENFKNVPEMKETNVIVEKMEVDEKDSKSKSENKCSTKTKFESCEQSIKPDLNENDCSISNGKNKTLKQIKKSSKVDKKRKRVLHISDSDSEVENDSEKEVHNIHPDSDDEIPPTPMANNIKITSGLVNPKKKRKIIDKTYQDDEGYILTKKVEVYESCSEDESKESKTDILPETKLKEVKKELSPKNNTKQKNKKKISSPQKGKQATLMNFFKRK